MRSTSSSSEDPPWLEPASYFLEMNPFSANRPNSRLAADIATADWLLLDKRWDRPTEPNLSAHEGSDLPNQIVRDRFVEVSEHFAAADLDAMFDPRRSIEARTATGGTAEQSIRFQIDELRSTLGRVAVFFSPPAGVP